MTLNEEKYTSKEPPPAFAGTYPTFLLFFARNEM